MRSSRSFSAHKVNYILARATRGSMEREREMKENGGKTGKNLVILKHVVHFKKTAQKVQDKKILLTLIN